MTEVGAWVFVYGLMVYFSACTVPEERGVQTARWWIGLMAVFLPLVFIIPLVFVMARLEGCSGIMEVGQAVVRPLPGVPRGSDDQAD